jgi:hypothetical protein
MKMIKELINNKKEKIKQWISSHLALIYGSRFSLDNKFKTKKAKAEIVFLEGEEYGGSIKIKIDGMIYYFEGMPEIERYKNFEGKQVVKKNLKYGGWEMDMMHKSNKIFN